MLPFNLVKHAFNFLSQRVTMSYSSAPIPREGWKWINNTVRTKALAAFTPDFGEMLCGIVPVCCNNII